jgi:hypothetical protein
VRSTRASQVEKDVGINNRQRALGCVVTGGRLRKQVVVIVVKPPEVQKRTIRAAPLSGMAHREVERLPHIVEVIITTTAQTDTEQMTGSTFQTVNQQSCNALTTKVMADRKMDDSSAVFGNPVQQVAGYSIIRSNRCKNSLTRGVILKRTSWKRTEAAPDTGIKFDDGFQKGRIQPNFHNPELVLTGYFGFNIRRHFVHRNK